MDRKKTDIKDYLSNINNTILAKSVDLNNVLRKKISTNNEVISGNNVAWFDK